MPPTLAPTHVSSDYAYHTSVRPVGPDRWPLWIALPVIITMAAIGWMGIIAAGRMVLNLIG